MATAAATAAAAAASSPSPSPPPPSTPLVNPIIEALLSISAGLLGVSGYPAALEHACADSLRWTVNEGVAVGHGRLRALAAAAAGGSSTAAAAAAAGKNARGGYGEGDMLFTAAPSCGGGGGGGGVRTGTGSTGDDSRAAAYAKLRDEDEDTAAPPPPLPSCGGRADAMAVVSHPASPPVSHSIAGAFEVFPVVIDRLQLELMYRSTAEMSRTFFRIASNGRLLIDVHEPCMAKDFFTYMVVRLIQTSCRTAGPAPARKGGYEWTQQRALCLARSDYMLDHGGGAKGRWGKQQSCVEGPVVHVEYNTISVGLGHLSDRTSKRTALTMLVAGSSLAASGRGKWAGGAGKVGLVETSGVLEFHDGAAAAAAACAEGRPPQPQQQRVACVRNRTVRHQCDSLAAAVKWYGDTQRDGGPGSVRCGCTLPAHETLECVRQRPTVTLFLVQPLEVNTVDQSGLEVALLEKGNLVVRRTMAQLALDRVFLGALLCGHYAGGSDGRGGGDDRCMFPTASLPEAGSVKESEQGTFSATRLPLGLPMFITCPEYAGVDAHGGVAGTYEVSAIYFRAGYSPDDYLTSLDQFWTASEATGSSGFSGDAGPPPVLKERLREVATVLSPSPGSPAAVEWVVRHIMESSIAIKGPNAAFHLVGSKRVQALLAMIPRDGSGVVDHGLPISESFGSVSAEQYPLSLSDFIADSAVDRKKARDALVAEVLRCPQEWVLKPQREGGQNNFFGEDLLTKLRELQRLDDDDGDVVVAVVVDDNDNDDAQKVSAAAEESFDEYVLMRLIDGQPVTTWVVSPVLVRNASASADVAPAVLPQAVPVVALPEYGVFASFVADQHAVAGDDGGPIGDVRAGGVLVRSKAVGVNEAGFLAGGGALAAVAIRMDDAKEED